jgi:ABC-type sugar transport system ATPase subunit
MYIKKLGIKTPKSREAVSKLSSGNQQKVLIAKWMLAKARVFILDEPTRGLDIGSKVEVYNLMNELARSGSGIIMISPELPELLGMCDRLLVLHKGRIAKELARHEASQELVFHYASGK